MSEKTVLVAAGGTGGHMFPAAAFSEEMKARGWRVVLMTDARGRRYADGFPADAVEDVPAATIQGLNPIKALTGGLKILAGISAASKRLDRLKPSLIAGFGGYPSFPALWAGRDKKIPILIFQADAVLGRVNRFFAKDAAVIACGFDRLDKLDPKLESRKVVTGIPIRAPVRAVREAPYPLVPAGGPINILITAGSQGARLFGEVVPEAVRMLPPELRSRLVLSQQVREEQVAGVKALYEQLGVSADVRPFFSDMPERLKASNLVIARGGGSSITECAIAGRPAIIVPLAIATDDHQTANADALVSVGAGDVLQEPQFDAPHLCALLNERLADMHVLSVRAAAARSVGKPDAAKALADVGEKLARG
jgi:UDP-N-acetylglucosamine--N-acetylmuramyl-(pentapeptide) pyrophosphoryl-undecaprenol N-acetylglucosamine transferase